MIITCEKCQAQFQLPDERVPEKGARVRCSKCKHAFFVAHPSAGGVVSAAQAPKPAPVKAATPQPAAKAASAAQAPVRPAQPRAATSIDKEDEVGDWGFNEDAKEKSGSFGKPKAHLDANLFEEPNPHLDSAHVDSVPAASDGESLFDAAAVAVSEADFGLGDGPATQAVTVDEGLGSDFSDLFSEKESAPVESAESSAAVTGSESSGGDDWDFFGDGKKQGGAAAATPSSADDFLNSISDSVAASSTKPAAANVASVVMSPMKKTSPLPPWFGRVNALVGWCVVAILILVIVVESMTPPPTFVAPEEGALKIGVLAADGVHGRMIENAVSGMLYVVSGQLRNDSSESTQAGMAIRVVLIDEHGQAIADTAAAMAGFALAEHQLRETKADELQQRLEVDSAKLAWTALAPKQTVQFDAVFPQMPDTAVGFRLETIDVAKPRPQFEMEFSDAADAATDVDAQSAEGLAAASDSTDAVETTPSDGEEITPNSVDPENLPEPAPVDSAPNGAPTAAPSSNTK